MKMCPKNQFVYGYMTRINENDGLNGLILMCRNKYTNEAANVTVREGKGVLLASEFILPRSNLFASDYSVKYESDSQNSFITGLHLLYSPFPVITNIDIQYDSLPPFDIKV
jgi:uncharacterized protein affecting Mg2+/Co2+ transport